MRKKEIALLASAAAVAYSLTLLLQAPFQACSVAAASYYAAGAPETGIKQGKIHETVMPGTPSPADYKPPTINDHELSYEEIDYDAAAIPETYWNNDWAFQDSQQEQQVSPAEPPKPTTPSTEASTEPSKETEKETETPREKETVPPSTEAPKETVPPTEASTIAPKNDKPRGGGNHNDRPIPIPTPTVSHPTNPSPSEHSMEDKVAAAEVVPGNDQAHIHGNSRASASNMETSRATNTDDTSQMNRNAVAALILLSAFVCYLAYLKSCPKD